MAIASLGDVAAPGLDGEITLRCTLGAWEEVNQRFGSYSEALRRLAIMDSTAYVFVIAAGLGKAPKDVKDIPYRIGMPALAGPLSEFVERLSNGGKLSSEVEAKGTDSGNA